MKNEVLDNLDYQLEKKAELEDRCAICGELFHGKDMIYKKHDGELVHERCMLDQISDSSMEYADYTTYRRYEISTQEIF